MRITVAHSPDSDDAFMFYGLASGAVDTGDLEVGHLLSDIETLNRAAFEGTYEVTATSDARARCGSKMDGRSRRGGVWSAEEP